MKIKKEIMALLFLLMAVSIGSIFFRKSKLTFILFLLTLLSCIGMLYFHMTDTLQIKL